MQSFKSVEELEALSDNTIIGAEGLKMQNSEIVFGGTGNILFVEDGVTLNGSKINFAFSNSVVYLSSSKSLYKLNLTVYNNCTCYFGKNNYMNGTLNIIVSEQTDVFIGEDCLFAFGIWIRTADPHLIYSSLTKKRVNPSKSVFIGDHVWVGQNALVLKGTQLASGGILGAGAVSAGKRIASNEAWAGNPAKRVSSDIFWDKSCVHAYTDKETAEHEAFGSDEYIFTHSEKDYLPFDTINSKLKSAKTADEKLEYLKGLSASRTKNRFSINEKRGLFHR